MTYVYWRVADTPLSEEPLLTCACLKVAEVVVEMAKEVFVEEVVEAVVDMVDC